MDHARGLLPTSVPTVEVLDEDGVAFCSPELKLLYANTTFRRWFPLSVDGVHLENVIPAFPGKRALKRLEKRGYFNLMFDAADVEGEAAHPPIAIGLKRITWEETQYIKVFVRDNSMLREKDAIISTHTKMLERSNRELQRKTRLLEERNEQLTALSSKLGKYLSPQVYQSIFTGENQVKVETYRKQLTVFFSDIQGFTALTDTLDPELLASVLNNYLQEMSEIAHRYGGTVDKFIGDGILIFFGDPKSKGIREDALAAVLMALEMRERMSELRAYWRGMGVGEPLHIRMGISSGECTVGNFGSERRMEYTVVGGQVNLASRLESIASVDEILVSEPTVSLLEDKIQCKDLGTVELKGFAEPVRVFSVVDYNFDQLAARDTRVQETFEGFNLSVDLSGANKERVVETLRKIINLIEFEKLTPTKSQAQASIPASDEQPSEP